MAMFLKLEASSPENTKIQSTPGIPDFMDWNQITSLPLFWKPFHSLTLTIAAIILVPGLFALIIGTAMFKRRVGGTYFAIITQAGHQDDCRSEEHTSELQSLTNLGCRLLLEHKNQIRCRFSHG